MSLSIACVYTVDRYSTLEQPLPDAGNIHLGLATIASILKQRGHNVRLLVFTPDTPVRTTLQPFIDKYRPRLFCLTAVTTQFPLVSRIAAAIKEIDPTIFVALGGSHATLAPEAALACAALDALCIGEGDAAVVELAARIEAGRQPSGIHNFWFREPGSGNVERNPPVPFLQDLDGLPFIDRELWRPWISQPELYPAVLLGRGCPFRCSYCSNHVFRKQAPGPYVRFRSPENVIAEIREIAADPEVAAIYLEVESISANLDYAFSLCQALAEFNRRRPAPVKFKINLAIISKILKNMDLLNRLFTAFNQANIVSLNIGLESGSERIRNEILNRPRYTNEDFLNFCAVAKKYQIGINVYVMMGIPGETYEDFQQTVRIVRQSKPSATMLAIFFPYPMTALHQFAKDKGLIDEQAISNPMERRRAYLELPEFPRWLILREYILFNYRVHQDDWSWLRRVAYTLRWAILVHPKLDHLFVHLSRKSTLCQAMIRRFSRGF